MQTLYFATGNKDKFVTAEAVCSAAGIRLLQKKLKVDEIQEEDTERVALDKAQKAFELLKEPVVITDDSWSFLGLNGFPGAYMHSMNEWFTPEDFLRLTAPLSDRRVILTQSLVYTDAVQQKIFKMSTNGTLLTEKRGNSEHAALTVIALEGENGLSVAEAFEQSKNKGNRVTAKVWQDFTAWYASTLL